jgi:hypothetical protein
VGIEFDESNEFQRDNQLLNQMAVMMNMTKEDFLIHLPRVIVLLSHQFKSNIKDQIAESGTLVLL